MPRRARRSRSPTLTGTAQKQHIKPSVGWVLEQISEYSSRYGLPRSRIFGVEFRVFLRWMPWTLEIGRGKGGSTKTRIPADWHDSDALPSITGFAFDKMRKDGSEYHQRHPSATAINVSTGPAGTQSSMYSGPPPPYTYPSTTANSTSTLASLISASEARKDSSDDKDQPARQGLSLPSIQEAILGDQQYAKTSPTSATHPVLSIPPRSHPLPALTAPDPHHTSPRNSHHPYSSVPHATFSASTPQSTTSSLPPRESTDTSGPPPHPAPTSSATSPLSPREPSAVPTPTSMHSQAYQSYSGVLSFAQQRAAAANVPSSPYRPSNLETTSSYTYPSSRFEPPELTRVDETRKHALSTTHGEVYGNSVRRHLDIFDLEASLNGVGVVLWTLPTDVLTNAQVMEGSGRLFDIARYHKTRAQETRGPTQAPAPMPTLDECDRMLQHHQSVGHSLTSMREMLLAQEKNVANQQAQSQRYKAAADYDMDTSSAYEDGKAANGMASDNKKRRAVRVMTRPKSELELSIKQRAAPPGRCHSCNRAETPEWRRGPDGARTLCNACGLRMMSDLLPLANANTWQSDYAKLTRKTKNSHASSLRPKSIDSPPPGSA